MALVKCNPVTGKESTKIIPYFPFPGIQDGITEDKALSCEGIYKLSMLRDEWNGKVVISCDPVISMEVFTQANRCITYADGY